jgi:hypothetical protein
MAHTCKPSYYKAEIRRIMVQSQLGQIVYETISQKKKPSQKMVGRVTQGYVLSITHTKKLNVF